MRAFHALFVVVLSLLLACGGPSTNPQTPADQMHHDGEGGSVTIPEDGDGAAPLAEGEIGIANEAHLESGLITGGQPSREALERAKAQGITTIISLRGPDEPGFEEERAAAEELGLDFISIPIVGDEAINEENWLRLAEALDEPGETVLHCGSGNRAGAMIALQAFFGDGATVDEALEAGRQAGMTRLEDTVREVLTVACTEDPERQECPTTE